MRECLLPTIQFRIFYLLVLLSKDRKFKMGRTVILPVVLYGCETWSLAVREDHRLRVFENRELRRILGPKREEVTGEWRKLHNEEPNDLYCLPNITRVMNSRRKSWGGGGVMLHVRWRREAHRRFLW